MLPPLSWPPSRFSLCFAAVPSRSLLSCGRRADSVFAAAAVLNSAFAAAAAVPFWSSSLTSGRKPRLTLLAGWGGPEGSWQVTVGRQFKPYKTHYRIPPAAFAQRRPCGVAWEAVPEPLRLIKRVPNALLAGAGRAGPGLRGSVWKDRLMDREPQWAADSFTRQCPLLVPTPNRVCIAEVRPRGPYRHGHRTLQLDTVTVTVHGRGPRAGRK